MVSEQRSRSYAAVLMAGESSDEDPIPQQGSPSPQTGFNSDDYINPLYLHGSENSNSLLVSPPLNSNNYNTWSRSMRMALEIKNKTGFIDGTIACPNADDPRFLLWKRCNTMIRSWIVRAVDPSIAEGILYYERASDMWEDLRNRYSQSDPHRISELQKMIFNNKQGNYSISDYYSKCRGLWEQLAMLRPLPLCECTPRCSCSLVTKIRKEREEDQVIMFLEGLNDEFDSVKSNVLLIEPVPSVDRVFKMALKVERKLIESNASLNNLSNTQANSVQNALNGVENEQNMAAAVSGTSSNFSSRKPNNGGRSNAKCTFCGMTGHTIEKCYKKHGYPPGWVPGYKLKARQAQGTTTTPNFSVNQVGDIGISNDQFQKLLSLIQGKVGHPSTSSSTAAHVSLNSNALAPHFITDNDETKEGPSWTDGWFC